jgi:hypothetical protein
VLKIKQALSTFLRLIPSCRPTSISLAEGNNLINGSLVSVLKKPTAFTTSSSIMQLVNLNLGVLGADMGYLNMYNKTGAVLNYITAIKELSDELKVGQFFNFETLKRLATNSENIDSLMYISVSAFDKMDTYLRENNRSDISALLVTGVWVEGLFLATQVVKDNDNPIIRERVGEQGIVLEQLLIVLNHYKKDKRFFELITEIEKVEAALAEVEIIIEEGEAEMMEVDGVLMAVSTETSTVVMSDEQLAKIIAVVEDLRDFVIKY